MAFFLVTPIPIVTTWRLDHSLTLKFGNGELKTTQNFLPAMTAKRLSIYDTTLRDGAQCEGLSLSLEDKLRIAHQLDRLGVPFIEGGWPGANPKDVKFFLATQGTAPHSSRSGGLLFDPSARTHRRR